MNRRLAKRASTLLALLPFAHGLTRTVSTPHLMTAAAIARHPIVRRFAPRLSTVATVGLAAIALASFIKGVRTKRPGVPVTDSAPLERSSIT